MNKPDKQQLLIFGLIGLLSVIFVCFFYFPLARKKLSVTREKIEYAETSLAAMKDVNQVPQLREAAGNLKQKVWNYNLAVPEGGDYAGFWQSITDLMASCSLEEASVQPGAEIKGDKICQIPISIRCSGTVEQIFGFFKRLESFERVISIEHVKLENDADYSGKVSLQAQAKIYYRPSKSRISG